MTVVITSNEPKDIRELFKDRIEYLMPYDIQLYTSSGLVCIERKKVPGDLLASVDDGRLGREISAMREQTDLRIILLQGIIKYRNDGTVVTGRRRLKREWTRKGIRNLRRTWEYVEGCYTEYADSKRELVNIVAEIQGYFDKGKHLGLKTRPGLQNNWIFPPRADRVMWFYQGLPGISVSRARTLYEQFPNPFELYEASLEDILGISGFGKVLASGIYNFLRGI